MPSLIYNWDPVTGVYAGASVADESPLEPGVLLLPAYATQTPPPLPSGPDCLIVWDGRGWAEVIPVPDPEPEPEPELEPEQEPEPEADLPPPMDPMDLLRSHRNSLLAECDWVVIRAYSRHEPVPAEWAAYMQALRDLLHVSSPTMNPDSPRQLDMTSVAWPVKPEAP